MRPPQVYGAPSVYGAGPGAFPPAPPARRKTRTGLVIGVVAALVVLLGGGGFFVAQAMRQVAAAPSITTPSAPGTTSASTSGVPSTAASSAPASTSASTSGAPSTTASASSTDAGYAGFTLSGTTLTGSNFTTSLPAGWVLSTANGGKNEGEVIDAKGNLLDYYSGFQRGAAENCAFQAQAISSASGVESAEPAVVVNGVTWGSGAATGLEVLLKRSSQTEQEVVGYYCVDHAGNSVLVRSVAWLTDRASVQTGAKELLAAWKWQ